MSSTARWSYTRKATFWPRLGRDDWTGLTTYGPPQVFACDYSAESKRMTDVKGVEFTTQQIIYTEFADAKQGDMLLIGETAEANPVTAGAFEIRATTRDSDTFQQLVDDWQLFT